MISRTDRAIRNGLAMRRPASAHTIDISSAGAFVQTDTPAPVGSHVELEFRIPAEVASCLGMPPQDELTITGRVAWTTNQDLHPGPSGMGIEFVDANPGKQILLMSVIDALADRS